MLGGGEIDRRLGSLACALVQMGRRNRVLTLEMLAVVTRATMVPMRRTGLCRRRVRVVDLNRLMLVLERLGEREARPREGVRHESDCKQNRVQAAHQCGDSTRCDSGQEGFMLCALQTL